MKIENINTNVSGSSVWNQGRNPGDELIVVLNLGNIDVELQDKYVEIAESTLSDDMDDDDVEYALTHGIWDNVCNG